MRVTASDTSEFSCCNIIAVIIIETENIEKVEVI